MPNSLLLSFNNPLLVLDLHNDLFLHYYKAWGGVEDYESDNLGIPDFFQRVPQDNEILPAKLREDARSALLERKSIGLLSNSELQEFWYLLERYHSPPTVNGEKFMNYENFRKASKEASPKAKQYFTASTFAKLLHEDEILSRINILAFFNYVMKKVWLQQTHVGISLYDVCGEGYLRETDLENYMLELIPTLCQLSVMESTFQTFYVCTAVRKFFFFLDPLRSGRVRITDILASGFLDSMLELREVTTSEAQLAANWFSHQSALRVYGSYLLLDEDRNGLLTRSELSQFGNGTLNDMFLDRVFQECLTYEGEMDYKTYLDLVLAMENKHEPQAIAYLFRILDVGGQGKLTSLTLRYFYDGIEEKLRASDNDPPSFDNILNEIFDMVRPVNPHYITLDDLINW
ncbi:Serine/threonine-protein phosphatase 2A regulatory subunit B'' subunit gamma isoform 2 [Schistosoma japonicum]|uniref:Serine/threonine-protein phosphatase 2A regulatory subunit B'' subunit gamma isoform 2 n=1 Tax=Schistosoma japonicum TaxID=6182 RepID=A0A4Z2DAC5_SCHJA|nr:Serine/threonine-protein phosphatase 2A regulatory subunit B'' subunit gamma [Schistosoma japonicum]TNN13457.1 Serine/threonine-protein phosphatase 2A regulatory subunit B'' subunit gamma isoform 2 [Schistosoma japonicum]